MHKIILFDGGIGQELVKRNRSKNDRLWSSKVLIDDFDLVVGVHKEFLEAGSKIITLNSYACTPQRLRNLKQENLFEKLQCLSIKAAKKAKQSKDKFKDIKIAGCLPPLEGSYKKKIKINKKEAFETYMDIVKLQKDHVDFFICETMSSIDEALIAYNAVNTSNKPIYLCFCVSEEDGSELISEEKLFDACKIFSSTKLSAIGINCCQFEVVDKALQEFKKFSIPFGVLPNGFKTIKPMMYGNNASTIEKRIDVQPSMFVEYSIKWIKSGCKFVGGCCEIGPDFIRLLNNKLLDSSIKVTNLL